MTDIPFQTADRGDEIIYVMRDVNTGAVRYVGRTSYDVRARAAHHKRFLRMGTSRFARWLQEHGWRLQAEPIEYCPRGIHAGPREYFWIRHYRAAGEPILNEWPYDDGLSPVQRKAATA